MVTKTLNPKHIKRDFYKDIVNTKDYSFVYLKFKNEKDFVPFAFLERRLNENDLEKIKEKNLYVYTLIHGNDMTEITHVKKESSFNFFGYLLSEEKIEKLENGETLEIDDYNLRSYSEFDENEIVD